MGVEIEEELVFVVVRRETSSDEEWRMRRGLLLLITVFDVGILLVLECCGPDDKSFKTISGGDSEIVELGVAKEVDEIAPAEMAKVCQFVGTWLLDVTVLDISRLRFCEFPVIDASRVDQSTIESSAGVVHDQFDVG